MNAFNPRQVAYLRTRPNGPASTHTLVDGPAGISAPWPGRLRGENATVKPAQQATETVTPTCGCDVRPGERSRFRRRIWFGGRLNEMLTTLPWRNAGWLAAVSGMLAAALFCVNGVMALRLRVGPEHDAARMIVRATAHVLSAIVGTLGLLAAFNMDRGTGGSRGGEAALLGSEEWVWWPGWRECRCVFLPTAGFWVGLFQFMAGPPLVLSAMACLPGVFDLERADAATILVDVPQITGACLLVAGGLLGVWLSQKRWYAPEPLDVSWLNGISNLLGVAGLLALGILAVLHPVFARSASGPIELATGLAMLLASALEWYIVLDNYLDNRPSAATLPSKCTAAEEDLYA